MRTVRSASAALPSPAENRDTRTLLLAFAVIVAVVFATCGPLLSRPQLDPDDARYLEIVERMSAEGIGALPDAFVVENRWDHLWWIALDQPVRFFRPAVVASYALDVAIAPFGIEEQLVLTNLLLHLACSLVLVTLALRWLPTAPAILAGVLFAAFAAHAENTWYVAGRTGTLAALGTLGALALHTRGTRGARAAAVAAFAFGLLAKETAVVAPVLCLLAGSWIERRGTIRQVLRADRVTYVGYAAVLAVYLVVRAVALGGGGVGFAPPYLVAPDDAAFAGHLVAQVVAYTQNLAAGTETMPFSHLDAALDATGFLSATAALAMLALLVVAAIRSPVGRFGVCAAVLTWLPASVAYLSERYLYLPSAGVALAVGAAVALPRRRALRVAMLAVIAVWALHQGAELWRRNVYNGVETTRGPARLAKTLEPVRARVPAGATVWLVNLPGNWIDAQFAEPTLRHLLDDPTLPVRVLTLMPRTPTLGRSVAVRRLPDGGVQVASQAEPVVLDFPKTLPWHDLRTGTTWSPAALDLVVEVVRGGGELAHALRFRPSESGEVPIVLTWRADPDQSLSPWVRVEEAHVDVLAR